MSTDALAQGPKELQNKGLVFLVAQTPNGNKPLYLAEELKAIGAIPDYTFVPISFAKNEQKSDWFEAINPNGRIPALLDNREGKKPINVWESASMLLYLAKTYDTGFNFHFQDEDLQTELLNWIFFIQGGVGPMQGQANHFFRYAPEKIPYGIKRYQDETKRLYGVYEAHLSGAKDGQKKEWLVGDKYTIADMCTEPWIRASTWAGVELEPFPHLAAWVDRIEQRPATKAALKIPEQDKLTQMKDNPEEAAKMAEKASKWIMAGQPK
ncbi:uncharacterized protein JCM10292_003720 [Rhodotorula paludigena]|uniref:uncharacterized protein n=1 Tax=Rhodotorula paludigena TaxID=86838 RepID=UPI0031761958